VVNARIPSLLLLFTAVVIPLVAATGALALFHRGGVGDCEGCHTIHNSLQGIGMSANLPSGMSNPYLLMGSDSSSTCLHCHQQTGDVGPTTFHVSTPDTEMAPGIPPKQLTPGGDFAWLKKSYSWVPALGQAVSYSYGERHGHNIRSNDYGYFPDGTKTAAPGGSFPSILLSCISCHDPHGKFRRNQDGSITTTGSPIKSSGSFDISPDPDAFSAVGSYRMLGGAGYAPKSQGTPFAFFSGPPAAVAPLFSNRSEDSTVTRVAYGAGMNDWCKNCHTNIHDDVYPGPIKHSSGVTIGSVYLYNYNRYVKSGDVSGVEATAYSSLVPFEIGTSNYAVLKGIVTNTPTKGPNASDGAPTIMCLSCHRAHASGWDEATRWNTVTDYVVNNGTFSQEGAVFQPYGQGRSELEAQRAYYNTPASKFAPMQKTLCNKCHVNDM
jgi:hypothetical protein